MLNQYDTQKFIKQLMHFFTLYLSIFYLTFMCVDFESQIFLQKIIKVEIRGFVLKLHICMLKVYGSMG